MTPVCSLQTFPLIEGLTGPQTLDVLHKRITALGARVSGQFVVDCETYFSAPSLREYCGYTRVGSSKPDTIFAGRL